MEKMNNNIPWTPNPYGGYYPYPYGRVVQPPPVREKTIFPAGKNELLFGLFAIIFGLLLCNFTLFGGFNVGFSITAILCIYVSVGYLVASGCRPSAYSWTLLTLCVIIAAGFARSDDGFVKFVMFLFLVVSYNLGLCLLAGQNRSNPSGITSLGDVPLSLFMGFGQMAPAFRGVGRTIRSGGPAIKKSGAVLLGLAVTIPLMCILIPLLMSADAAFEGLIRLLPDFELNEVFATIIFGGGAACVLYTRGAALRHKPKKVCVEKKPMKGISHLTVNTVLGAVCLVYLVYLVGQLAYFTGAFAGILPKSFTMAEYARRGFFEMAWLCAIDLIVMALAIGLTAKKDGKAPMSTRLLCLLVGLVTVFLVSTASAKMCMYIDAYGLTRLRLLTEVIMVFLAIATAVVSVWLFAPKLAYMKVLLIVAMVIGAAVIWVDVDTVVARYNVSAYQSGKLETIDLDYLSGLGDGAIPQIAKLTDSENPWVAQQAQEIMNRERRDDCDFRSWNYASWRAEELMK
ncbi:MAG: DUF4173 domain-containing protein [Ruminococcaceae bacterium]|nr:DUF4173 domain-containing protein [Oscillospiraceae bacterium]